MEQPPALAPAPTDEMLYNTLKELIVNIPDMEAVTLKHLRQRVAQHLGLGEDGLEGRKQIVSDFATAIIQEKTPPNFDIDGKQVPGDASPEATALFSQALAATRGLVLRKLPKPRFVPMGEAQCGVDMLPLRPWLGHNPVKAVVDIIKDHPMAVDQQEMMRCIMEGDTAGLPAVTKSPVVRVQVNHFTQVALLPSGDRWTVVKFIAFQSDAHDGKVKAQLAAAYCLGKPYLINYGSNMKNGKKVFHHLFEMLGGIQIRQWELQGGSGPSAVEVVSGAEAAAIDLGFDFIEKSWTERSIPTLGVGQMRWIAKQLITPTSPLYAQGDYKWTEKYIEKACTKLREQGSLARAVADCPYTLKTLQPWFVDGVLTQLAPHLDIRSIGFIGSAGSGKTPAMETIACMFSRYWKRKLSLPGGACYRLGSDLDFFRGDVGTRDRPDGLDDADPKTIPPAKWKAFADVGLTEAMTRERWGASKWVRNQLRLFAFNPICVTGEPRAGVFVTHAQFLQIINPCWHKDMDDESVLAVLKRSCLVVITKVWCYWRIASEKENDVPRIERPLDLAGRSSLVDPGASHVVSAWKEQRVELPEDYEEQLAFEETWLNAVLSKGALQVPSTGVQPMPDAATPLGGLRLPDRLPTTQPSQASIMGGEVVAMADADGHFQLPPLNKRLHSATLARAQTASASSSSGAHGAWADVMRHMVPKLEAGDNKKMKVETARADQKVEEFRRQLSQAEEERDAAMQGGVKVEMEVETVFSTLHANLSTESQVTPIEIPDSPEPDSAVIGDYADASGGRGIDDSQISRAMDAEAYEDSP